MAQPSSTLLLCFFGVVSALVVACDTASTYAGCPDPADPARGGTDPHDCQQSNFPDQDFRGHEISGTARRGEDGVAGAEIHVAPSPILVTDANALTTTVSADQVGYYRVAAVGAAQVADYYDLTIKLPNGLSGRDDIVQYLGCALRGFDPEIEVSGRTLPRSWASHVDVEFDVPVESDHTILFLANGTNVFGVTGDMSTGLDVHTLDFTDTATIHAIEYDPSKGLISASKYGKVDVYTDAANPKSITMHVDPITNFATPSFTLAAPAGFVPNTVDIRFSATRTSDALLVSIPYGQAMQVPVIPNMGYTYELTAKAADGSTTDSGETYFDPHVTAAISLPTPPTVTGPAPLAQLTHGDTLSAGGSGVIEHVFEPLQDGFAGLRILVADSQQVTLPDPSVVNEQKLTGAYVWTVRRFSNTTYVEQIGGPDARRYRPVATSAPRTIFLR